VFNGTIQSIRIYDRWGGKIFESNGKGWDGGGNPSGVYSCQVIAYDVHGTPYVSKTALHLLR
jgi:hypothetical protein